MSHPYFFTPEKILIFQLTASLIVGTDGKIQTEEIDVIISIHPTLKNHTPCFRATVIDASFIKGQPITKDWLENLRSNQYGVDVTEYTNGPVVYYYNQEQLLDAVMHSFTTTHQRLITQL